MSTPFFGRLSIHLDRTGFKPPHLFSKIHARGRVWQKSAALVPLTAAAFALQGWTAVTALGAAVCGALIAEALGAWLFKRAPAYHDGESIFIGLFCGLILPLSLSAGFFFAAAFIAVFIGREIFGGFGQALLFPPAAGLLLLFLAAPEMIQAFDFKAARSLVSTAALNADGHLNGMNLLFYAGSAAPEDVSFFALLAGVLILLRCGLVRWELPLCFFAASAAVRFFLEQTGPLFLLSGGWWLTVFWGAAQTSAMPLTPAGRRLYALLAGLLAAVCPLEDESLRSLTGFAAASFISPWLDTALTASRSREAEAV